MQETCCLDHHLHKNNSLIVYVLVGFILLLSCSITKKNVGKSDGPNAELGIRNVVVHSAQKYLGAPYKYGGTDRNGYDCSGLMFNVFKTVDILLPRTSVNQFRHGKRIEWKEAQIGDLIFFTQKGKINHVAVVTKKSKRELWVIHSTTSKGVITENINSSTYWKTRIVGARNVISR